MTRDVARQQRRQPERAADIPAARRGRQTRLRRRGRDVRQRACTTGSSSRGREVGRLIEAALDAAPRVQRHRDGAVRVAKELAPGVAHQAAEARASERRPSYLNA